MTSYSSGRNSVEEINFELLKSMPKNLPLHLQLDSDFLGGLLRQQPKATLKELCQAVLSKRGIHISPQTMCRLLIRMGFIGAVRRQLQAEPDNSQQPARTMA